MSDTAMVPRNPGDRGPALPPVVDQELADQLLARAQAERLELLGPDGLLSPGHQGGAGAGAGRGDDRTPRL